MPRVSSRQQSLREVKKHLMLNIGVQSSSEEGSSASEVDSLDLGFTESNSDMDYDSSDDSEVIGDMFELEGSPEGLLKLYSLMQSTRYFVEKGVTTKSKEFATQFFAALPAPQFRQMTRMDKPAFFGLVRMIQFHSVFQSNSANEQAPVEYQLAVTLDRLGHNGNGSCLSHMIPIWGVSVGSLCNFTRRCFVALESVLKNFLRWPNRSERQSILMNLPRGAFLAALD
jgi:hypothetical protein